ncbi:MAG: hypothetical protein ACPLYC_01325, partial [Minisyncoccia bacterium]
MNQTIIYAFKTIIKIFSYTWWIWAAILAFLAYQNKRKKRWVEKKEYNLLQITVPKENEKSPLAAEMMFAALHGIYRRPSERLVKGYIQEHISFEIVSFNNKIKFYVWVPSDLQDFVEGQIYAQYPNAEIRQVPDYTDGKFLQEQKKIITTELILNKLDFYPIKTFPNFEVDTLAGITATLFKLEEKGEQAWIQILIRPADEHWQSKALAYVESIRSGKSSNLFLKIINYIFKFITTLISALVSPENINQTEKSENLSLSPAQENALKAVEEKASKLGFETKIRIAYIASSEKVALSRIRGVVGAFQQYTTVLNGFIPHNLNVGKSALNYYKSRAFLDKGFILNIEELASIFHLPNVTVETPTISWTSSKKGEPPENLPIVNENVNPNITILGETNFRHMIKKFGIKTDDRRR